jgi:hypothetical protein
MFRGLNEIYCYARGRAHSGYPPGCRFDDRKTYFGLPAPHFEIRCPHLDLMNSFRNHRLHYFAVPMSTNWLLIGLAEAKGRQALYTRQRLLAKSETSNISQTR